MGRVRGARRGLADGCLYNGMPAARAAHGIGHGASCRDHPSTPGSGWDGRLRPCAFPDAPLCLLGLAAQRAHDDPEILRIDGARPVLIEQVERVLDLVELVLIELLLSSVELALCSLLGLRTRANRQQPGCEWAWASRAPGSSCCCPACSPWLREAALRATLPPQQKRATNCRAQCVKAGQRSS